MHQMQHSTEDAFMVPGMGAQPVRYVAANDNVAGSNLGRPMRGQLTAEEIDELDDAFMCGPAGFIAGMTDEQMLAVGCGNGEPTEWEPAVAISDYYRGAVQSYVDGYLNCEVGAPLGELPIGLSVETNTGKSSIVYELRPSSADTGRHGPYVSTAPGGRFFPLDPRPEDIDIDHIARSMSMTCRYNGAVQRFFSTAEHSVHIARGLVKRHGKNVALCGLLHDAPESLSGFGDVVSPVKAWFPIVGEIEDDIWRKAIAPRFGLPLNIPDAVHDFDRRIRGNELANMSPMSWHDGYNNPLDVTLHYWSPSEAEVEFLATFEALTS